MKVKPAWDHILFLSETDDEVACLFNMYEQIKNAVDCEYSDKDGVFELIIHTYY